MESAVIKHRMHGVNLFVLLTRRSSKFSPSEYSDTLHCLGAIYLSFAFVLLWFALVVVFISVLWRHKHTREFYPLIGFYIEFIPPTQSFLSIIFCGGQHLIHLLIFVFGFHRFGWLYSKRHNRKIVGRTSWWFLKLAFKKLVKLCLFVASSFNYVLDSWWRRPIDRTRATNKYFHFSNVHRIYWA